tara:strand:- start:9687 stop:10133 length:447 start_codon:yes stop_codon:yes gene_type:complete
MSKKQEKEILFNKIREADKEFLFLNRYPEHGELVISGLIQNKEYNFDNSVGYVVQIRKKRGDFGTDQYFLRHCNGKITVHENQSFYVVPESLVDEALSFFEIKKEEEPKDEIEYIYQGYKETGFMIDFKEGDPVSKGDPFIMTTTQIK